MSRHLEELATPRISVGGTPLSAESRIRRGRKRKGGHAADGCKPCC